jgi:hypothetical protein
MNPTQRPSQEKMAATDELFKGDPVDSAPVTEVKQDEESTDTSAEEAKKHASPLRDYVRELQQEYEEQQEEGKL